MFQSAASKGWHSARLQWCQPKGVPHSDGSMEIVQYTYSKEKHIMVQFEYHHLSGL